MTCFITNFPPDHAGRRRAVALCMPRPLLLLSLGLVLLAVVVRAQDPRGSLVGVVQDAKGGRVPAAAVVVRAAGSALEREASTDPFGNFRLDGLPPGGYQVIVNAHGFAEARADVVVVVSSAQEITVTMRLETLAQKLDVKGQASSITTQAIDLTGTVHQGAVSAEDLDGHSARPSHLCQHRLSRSRNRTGGALRPHQGAHYRRHLRRQFRPERSAFGGWRGQFR